MSLWSCGSQVCQLREKITLVCVSFCEPPSTFTSWDASVTRAASGSSMPCESCKIEGKKSIGSESRAGSTDGRAGGGQRIGASRSCAFIGSGERQVFAFDAAPKLSDRARSSPYRRYFLFYSRRWNCSTSHAMRRVPRFNLGISARLHAQITVCPFRVRN